MTEAALNLAELRALLAASDAEAQRDDGMRQQAAEALQMALWRMRRQLLDAAVAAHDAPIAALAPFAKVAALLKRNERGVLLSLRGASRRADFVQLHGAHFFRAAELVAAHPVRS